MKRIFFILACFFSVGILFGSYNWHMVGRLEDPAVLRALRKGALQSRLNQMVERLPFDRVKDVVNEAFPYEEPWMHNDIGHYLGELAYQRYGLKAFVLCASFFNEGCYHGVIELLGRTHGPDPTYFQQLKAACEAEKDYTVCSHPLGHAASALSNYDIMKALRVCDETYPTEERLRFECWFGAIMEYNAEVVLKAGDEEEKVMSLCRQYPEQYQGACIQLQLHSLSFLWKNDFVRLANHCRSFATQELVDMCADEFGFVIAAYNYFSDPAKSVSVCDEFPDLRDWCLTGIIRTYRTNSRRDIAQSVCDMLHDEEMRRYCL